jgi:hypothetical protein
MATVTAFEAKTRSSHATTSLLRGWSRRAHRVKTTSVAAFKVCATSSS